MTTRAKRILQLARGKENRSENNQNQGDSMCINQRKRQEMAQKNVKECLYQIDNQVEIFDVPIDEPFELPPPVVQKVTMLEIIGDEVENSYALLETMEFHSTSSPVRGNENYIAENETQENYYEINGIMLETEHDNGRNSSQEQVNEQMTKNPDTSDTDLFVEDNNKNITPLGQQELPYNIENGHNNQQINEEELSDNGKRLDKRKPPRREINKTKRLRGKGYKGYTRRHGKVENKTDREERKIRSRCTHTKTDKKTDKTFLCGLVTDEDRANCFDYFWSLSSWDSRKSYIKGLVSTTAPSRRRKKTNNNSPRKATSHGCYLPIKIGNKIRVCRTMLLNTFGIGRDTFQRWCRTDLNSNDAMHDDEMVDDNMRDKEKPGTIPLKRTNKKKHVEEWFKMLPKVPSHYCRKSSKKLYVESTFRSKLHLYQIFSEYCRDNQLAVVSRTLFGQILKQQNISIHRPRKDQCDTCYSFKTGNTPEDEYLQHVEKKNESHNAKLVAKESAQGNKLVVTMDLQSVLLAPKLEASSIYYKQKLQIHDFTIYALNNGDVDLYVWHECNGGVTANEFTSCVVDYVKSKSDTYKHIVLISDGCGYQNRNKTLSSALSDLCESLEITIEQLILERGHTMMEADAVHSSLEAHFKPPIFAPCDYITRMRQARKHHPYNVHVLDHHFFKNYDSISKLSGIRPTLPNKVTDLRGLLYLSTGEIKYKIRHTDEWTSLQKRSSRNNEKAIANKQPLEPPQLYSRQIKISEQKFKHLQELKNVIETDHHPFYDNLPH